MGADVFISYSSLDRDRVIPVVDYLRSSGISVWVDEGNIHAADLWSEQIVQAIGALTGQDLWDPQYRFLTTIPSKVDGGEVTMIVLLALLLSFLATLYPAWKAASTDPVQVLRYE